jgi:hypothetical protein
MKYLSLIRGQAVDKRGTGYAWGPCRFPQSFLTKFLDW